MNPYNLSTTGIIFMIAGAFGIIIPGIFFFQYMQNIIATGASTTTGTTNPAAALSLINSAENSPWMVTLAFFGLGFLIIGGVFVAIASLSVQLQETAEARTVNRLPHQVPQQTPTVQVQQQQQALRACTKCGSFLTMNSAFCPNCGSPLLKVQPMIPA